MEEKNIFVSVSEIASESDTVKTIPENNSTLNNNEVKNSKKAPTVKTNKRVRPKAKTETTKKDNKKPRHLVIGHKTDLLSGWSFCYSETTTLREILVDFAKIIDTSTNKVESTLYSDIIANLDETIGIKLSFLLMEKMFGYKIDFIGEISKLYRGEDFLNRLIEKKNNKNEPIPF